MFLKKIILVATVCCGTAAAGQQSRPTLLVDIRIAGLDPDIVESVLPLLPEGGFKRLATQGAVIEELDFGGITDDTAALALLSTGATPAVNGIGGTMHFNPASRTLLNIFNDPSQLGNYTSETYSPDALRVSTVADEVKIDAGGLGNVFAIAVEPSWAISAAGHSANSAVWIDDTNGKWATTTYYKDLPSPVSGQNQRMPLSVRIDTMAWKPTVPDAAYASLPSYKRIYPFRHYFAPSDPLRYKAFKNSPLANREVTDLAIDYIKFMNLGRREPVDMLSLTYSLQPFLFGKEGDNRAETIDAYFRLDRDIARLLKALDTDGPTTAKTLVTVCGTPATPFARQDDEKFRIPSGIFSPARAMSLLKMDLMATFGNGDWVSGYHDGQVYLNRDLIRERGADYDAIVAESTDFLRKMSGITHAASLTKVMDGTNTQGIFPSPALIDVDNAGDIFINVSPGWAITSDTGSNSLPLVKRASASTSMAFILGNWVAPQQIRQATDARAWAPTVCRLSGIRRPNGASLPPLTF